MTGDLIPCDRCGQPHPRCQAHATNEDGSKRPCMQWPRKGSKVCKRHGGAAPQVRAAGERRLAVAEQAAAAESLGLVIDTNAVEALQDALNRRRSDVLWAAVKISQLGPDEYKQRDMSGKFERPSVWYELYERSLSKYEEIAAKCVSLGIAAQAVDVVRRQADQVQAVLEGTLRRLGHDWSDPTVVAAVDAALGELEAGEGEAA